MSSIHIGTITFDWYPYEPRAHRLAQASVDAGYMVDVICLRQPQQKSYEVYNGVHIYRVPMNRSYSRSLPTTLLSWCWFLVLATITVTWLHLKHPYDVIQVHNMPDFLVFSAFFPKLLGAKVILDVQDASPELMADKAKGKLRKVVMSLAILQEKISTAFADYVITIGWTVEELLLQRGVPEKKLTSILNSADPKVFPPQQSFLPAKSSEVIEPFILMYHGTVADRQGLDIAIRAVAMARRAIPQLRLEIKGIGDQIPYLKQLSEELGINDVVLFRDFGPVDEVADFILHGDVGIMPYRPNGYMELVLPTKAFEFALLHRPMIASDIRGIRSMFRPESIMLCHPSDPASFAEAIINLYHSPEKRIQLVANAADDYSPYRWELMAKHYQHLLQQLCHNRVQEPPPVAYSEIS